MRVLYAIQGTGNGHMTRARDIVPILKERCALSVLVSGTQADIELPFPVDYSLKGLSFVFGKDGGVDLLATAKKVKPKQLLKEINSIDVECYDLIINDFEPISAWAAFIKKKPLVALSHQAAILQPNTPQPKHVDLKGLLILKNYAPSSIKYGFHFQPYADNIYPPVIRKEVRKLHVTNGDHYTVYLPSYSHERLVSLLSSLPQAAWHIFSKHSKAVLEEGNCKVFPVSNNSFLESMAASRGILCGAGFETPAEALFLGKKLMVIPMKNQLEQYYNAAALKALGVPVIPFFDKRYVPILQDWLKSEQLTKVNYPDITAEIIDRVLAENQVSSIQNSDAQSYFSFRIF